MKRTRSGAGLTPKRRHEIEAAARRRAQGGTAQVAGRQQLDEWITEGWFDPAMTVSKMAEQYGVTERYVKMRRRELGLPQRKGGRPRKT